MLRQAQHERVWQGRLVSHPAAPPAAVAEVAVTLGHGRLTFTVAGPLKLPAAVVPVRTDGLWKTTCFELFVQPAGGPGYAEYNFSPSTAWAAYRFDDYRAGMRDLAIAAPIIARAGNGFEIAVDPALIVPRARIGLSAVIVEPDGRTSYWALAHPDGPPDFHDPACFVLTLPAPDRA